MGGISKGLWRIRGAGGKQKKTPVVSFIRKAWFGEEMVVAEGVWSKGGTCLNSDGKESTEKKTYRK